MFKNIIPGLVTVDTKLNKVSGLYYSDNFKFYSPVSNKGSFHYRICIDNIEIPKKYDFKDAFLIKSKNKWYYYRKLGIFNLKFCYIPSKRTFIFNNFYSYLHFRIGDIVPIGTLISDFINLDLFLNGIVSIKGCAYYYKNKNVCILAPSNNGKTKLIEKVLDKKGKYIAEDIVILNLQKRIIYPNSTRSNIFTIKKDKRIRKVRKEEIIANPRKINEIFLIQNSTTENYIAKNKSIYDYFFIWRVPFNINPILRSYVFEEKLRNKIDYNLGIIRKQKIDYKHKQIKNFDYTFLEI